MYKGRHECLPNDFNYSQGNTNKTTSQAGINGLLGYRARQQIAEAQWTMVLHRKAAIDNKQVGTNLGCRSSFTDPEI